MQGFHCRLVLISSIWGRSKDKGKVTKKLAYNLIFETSLGLFVDSWISWIWKATCPQKIKLFVWLCFNNQVLT